MEKLAIKHGVSPYEVEEIFAGEPRVNFVENGRRKGEDIYAATGQTDSGRYLAVIFIRKGPGRALIVSARDIPHPNARGTRKMPSKKKTSISGASTDAEIGDYWDTHSLTNVIDWDNPLPVKFKVKRGSTYFPIESELTNGLREIAKEKGVSAEALLNTWLRDRIKRKRPAGTARPATPRS